MKVPKMKIPKKIKVGGHIIKVEQSKELPDANGKFEWKENTMYICKTLPQSQKESTFFHELFHIMNTTLNNSMHAAIDSLAEQFYQVLKDNDLLK